MTARQIARRKSGTSVITTAHLGASGFAQADGTTRWTTAGTVNGHLVLEGRTADKVFVPLDSATRFEVA